MLYGLVFKCTLLGTCGNNGAETKAELLGIFTQHQNWDKHPVITGSGNDGRKRNPDL